MKINIIIVTLIVISIANASYQHAATSQLWCNTQAPLQYYPDYGTCSNDTDMQTCFNYLGTLSAQQGESVRNYCDDSTENHEDDISIIIESRYRNQNLTSDGLTNNNGENLKDAFESAPQNQTGYCVFSDAEFPFSSNQQECPNGEEENIIWKYEVNWSDNEDAYYQFQFGLDFGLGTAIQLDGFWVYTTNEDIWWGGNYDWNNADVIEIDQNLTAGPHKLTVYGQEGCCDGLQTITFRRNSNGPYQHITKNSLKNGLAGQYNNGYTHNGIEVYYHEFTIDYINNFVFNPFCLTQDVEINGVKILEGPNDINQWSLTTGGEESFFKIKHADLVPLYGCSYNEASDAFRWYCPMKITFYFGKNTQYIYNFHLRVFLSREVGATTEVTVTPNVVEGNCCTNELEIGTELQLVTDISGNTELGKDLTGTYTAVRMSDLFIKHYITTQEFDYLYLEEVEIKIGPFSPNILQANYEEGYTVYRVENFIAGANQDISVVSKLDDSALNDWNTRRRLAEIGSNYQVKSTGTVTFTEEDLNDKMKQQQEKKSEENTSDVPVAIGVSSAIGLVLGGLIGAGIVYILFLKNSIQGQKKQSDINNYVESNIESQKNSAIDKNQAFMEN